MAPWRVFLGRLSPSPAFNYTLPAWRGRGYQLQPVNLFFSNMPPRWGSVFFGFGSTEMPRLWRWGAVGRGIWVFEIRGGTRVEGLVCGTPGGVQFSFGEDTGGVARGAQPPANGV